jgi:hypothetical protein
MIQIYLLKTLFCISSQTLPWNRIHNIHYIIPDPELKVFRIQIPGQVSDMEMYTSGVKNIKTFSIYLYVRSGS